MHGSYNEFLELYHQEGYEFLNDIAIGEAWITLQTLH
jgi:hypothetical protein